VHINVDKYTLILQIMRTVIKDENTSICELTHQYGDSLLGLPAGPILLSWKIRSSRANSTQTCYRIQVSDSERFTNILGDTLFVVSSQQVGVSAPAEAALSRSTYFVRVQIHTEAGCTDWSPVMKYETGLAQIEDWSAMAIGDLSSQESPSPMLRREIKLRSTPLRARLYVTSLGLNEFYINGKSVGQGLLNPGWTTYGQRLLVETHDVTNLLTEGTNCLGAMLSDGWWRGKLGFMNGFNYYGNQIALLSQLEVDYENGESERFVTDKSWKTNTGEVRFSSIYDGCTIDYTQEKDDWKTAGYDDSEWAPVSIHHLDKEILAQRITPPVEVIKELPLNIVREPNRYLLESPQNIAGWVRLKVRGKAGQTIVVRHSEVLEPDGALHTRALRSAKATDTYVLSSDGVFSLEPKFTFHGFQFAEVLTDAEVLTADAIAISSQMKKRSNFICSNEKLNKLHENVVWSLLDNFVSVPTDCPQRDERMGWTGDAQAFANTANTLFDTSSFWRSWLVDLELDQYPNGDVSAVVPDMLRNNSPAADWIFEGRAGWGDAATFIPMSHYVYFGDKSLLQAQRDSMRRWCDALIARRASNKFLPQQFQFGDWCDPDAPADKPWLSKVSPEFVANSYFAQSLSVMAKTESLLGDDIRASHYGSLAEALRNDIWDNFGEEAVTTTAGCAIALEFEIAPVSDRTKVAQSLAEIVEQDDYKISTGFLATPLILHALSKNGYADIAYQMLLRTGFRSWLYAVEKGATTVWERWDAITESGDIHNGGNDSDGGADSESSMISFNHYAYGAVIDWVYRNIGGISPTLTGPGYQEFEIAPILNSSIESAATSIDTEFGLIDFRWKLEGSNLTGTLSVPFGATAKLSIPTSENSTVQVNGLSADSSILLRHGEYKISVTEAEVIEFQSQILISK
jgi:alpha-L-rhamnosidase